MGRNWQNRPMDAAALAAHIDHTCLSVGASLAQIDQLCDEAREHGFFSVCVHPIWVSHCAQRLESSRVKVCTVVAFPHGETLAMAKAQEARLAQAAGADEIDMVLARSLVHAGDAPALEAEVRLVVEAVPLALVKVILETASLSPDEIDLACDSVVATWIASTDWKISLAKFVACSVAARWAARYRWMYLRAISTIVTIRMHGMTVTIVIRTSIRAIHATARTAKIMFPQRWMYCSR